jgi:hypothetical protein
MHTRNMFWENFITKEQLRWRKMKGLQYPDHHTRDSGT